MRALLVASIAVVSAAVLSGCTASAKHATQAETRTVSFRVEKASQHFGHSTSEVDGMLVHPAWIDGCRGRLISSGEPFVIWWNNNEIRDLPFGFEEGKAYLLRFQGEPETGIMGYKGKCLHIRRILDSREIE